MDAFVRTLSISNSQQVEDVAKHCAKLIIWLQCDNFDVDAKIDGGNQQQQKQRTAYYPYSNLTYNDIETMFKATLYLHNCFHIHGGKQLLQAMLVDYAWARHQLTTYYDQYTKDICITQLCRSIINSGPSDQLSSRYCIVMQLLKTVSDIEPNWQKHLNEDFIDIAKTRKGLDYDFHNDDEDENLKQMLNIVQSIFELPTKAGIEKAVQRILQYLPFNILGQLFKITTKSTHALYHKCEVLSEMVCHELMPVITKPTEESSSLVVSLTSSSSTAAGHFIKAIYLYSGSSRHGLQFLWQCLAHHTFANSLIQNLLHFYDQQLQYINMDTLELDSLVKSAVPLECILYISHVLLARMSPCRIKFYALIKETDFSETLLALINKIAYVYS